MFGILTLKDDFTICSLDDFVTSLKDSFAQWDVVIVDMAEVKSVDIAAVQLLIAAKKEGTRTGRELIIRKTEKVTNFLRTVGIQL